MFRTRFVRRAESELIDILIRLDERKVFIHRGYASLFDYCLKALHLSEAHACNLIAVARKSQEIPALKTELLAGALSVSKARKVAPVLTRDNAPTWLEKAKRLTHKALEREVARVRPEVLVREGARYLSEDRLSLQVSVSEELMEQIGRLRELVSQRQRKTVTLEKTLEVVVNEYLERHDPVRRAKRVLGKKKEATANLPVARQVSWQSEWAREGRFLEFHHLKPVSQGGEHTAENLVLLCSAHHRHRHFRMAAHGGPPVWRSGAQQKLELNDGAASFSDTFSS